MEQTYTFYELGYLEYLWYFVYSLYYEFLEYPLMIRLCSVILIGLILIIPTTVLLFFIRNQLIIRKKNKLKRVRERYSGVFREILKNPNNLSEDIVREEILNCRSKKSSSKFSSSELELISKLLAEKVQDYNERRLNRHNYQQILYVLNIAGWLEDRIEKGSVTTCIRSFQTAQILDCTLRGSVSTRFAYHRNKELRSVARSTYTLTNREDPFRYMEPDTDFLYHDSDGPAIHDMLLYRRDNNMLMPNFIDWIKLDQPTNKFRLFTIDEIAFFNNTELSDELYDYMLKTNDTQVKGRAIRALGKLGYTKMEDELCAMFANSAGYMRASIIVALRDLGLRGTKIVNFFKEAYTLARREKVMMTILDALYCCGEEGRAAFYALESTALDKDKLRFEHIKNTLTNDRAYER
ncbi:MAG: hypothetical protein IKM65_03845 [Bacteroidaceae bacterium]|nr:hypothetical protein [Bacteroidaceae bacterium]